MRVGLALYQNEINGEFILKAARGMPEDAAPPLAAILKEKGLVNSNREMLVLGEIESPEAYANDIDLHSGLLAPVRIDDNRMGTIAIFRGKNEPVTDAMDAGAAQFIRTQIDMAFKNAGSYVEAQQMVFRDDLTGLFNMRYMEIVLDAECKRAQRYKAPVSVLFLDLDFFKKVNDQHGHLIGSKVLREVAHVLGICVREIDSIIRYGGDEFVVILTETGREGAEKVAERIRETVSEHVFLAREGIHYHLTCCIGVASFPEDAEAPQDLIHLADTAMYRGKETTRNVVYSAASLLNV